MIVQKLRIKSLDYSEGVIQDKNAGSKLTASCVDSISIKGSWDNCTSFYYTRKIEFSPINLFTLSVVIFAIVSNDDPKKKAPSEDEILSEFRKDQSSLSSISAEASLFISQAIKENHGFAMVTPPVFLEADKASKSNNQ